VGWWGDLGCKHVSLAELFKGEGITKNVGVKTKSLDPRYLAT
jgi:hypothetical protein